MKVLWTRPAELRFEELRSRAIDTGNLPQFIHAHNELVARLRDPHQAATMGEPLYRTRLPGGEVRHWIHRFIAVTYAVFPGEQVVWIVRYQSVPESWPD